MFSNLKHSTCYMWLVWTLVPPHPKKNLGPVSFCWILNFSSISQAIIVGLAGLAMLQVTNPYTLVPFHNSFAFFPRIDCSTNCTIELTINQYIYIYTYHNMTYSSILGVQNSQWTNSAKHSGQLRKLVTKNCDEPPSLSNCHSLLFFTFRSQVQFISYEYSCWMRAFSLGLLMALLLEWKDWYFRKRERLI